MPPADHGALRLDGRRVLIAEDDFFLAAELARDFRRWGALVVGPLASLAAAREAVAREPRLDGAVLDVNLRGERVYPLVDILAALGVPCVFATGYDPHAAPPAYRYVPRCHKPATSRAVAEALFG